MRFPEWLMYRRGLWRIHWGCCPECSSDAPELDSCQYCKGHRGWRDKKERHRMMLEWMDKYGQLYQAYWT